MLRRSWFPLALLVTACAPKAAPSPEPAGDATPPDQAAASEAAAPPPSAALTMAIELSDRTCACSSIDCLAETTHWAEEWTEANPDVQPTEGELEAIRTEIERGQGCVDRVLADAGYESEAEARAAFEAREHEAGAPIVTKTTEFADRICKCKSVSCIEKITTEMQAWAEDHRDSHGTQAQAERIDAETERMSECYHRVAGGKKSPPAEPRR